MKLTESIEKSNRYRFSEGGLICSDFCNLSRLAPLFIGPMGNNDLDHDDQDNVKSFMDANSGFS